MVRFGWDEMWRSRSRKVKGWSSSHMVEISNMGVRAFDKDVCCAWDGRNLSLDSQGLGMDGDIVLIGQVVESVAVVVSFIAVRWQEVG